MIPVSLSKVRKAMCRQGAASSRVKTICGRLSGTPHLARDFMPPSLPVLFSNPPLDDPIVADFCRRFNGESQCGSVRRTSPSACR